MAGAVQTLSLSQLPAYGNQLGKELVGGDWQRALKACLVAIKADTKKNFVEAHDPEGNAWLPLKRPRPGSKGKDRPLRDTGLLMASVSARGQGGYEQIEDTRLEMGTVLDYAGYQQDGTRFIPARPFLGFGPQLMDLIERIIGEEIDRRAAG